MKLRADRTPAQHLEVFLDVGSRSLGVVMLVAGIALLLVYGWMKLDAAGLPIDVPAAPASGTLGIRGCADCPTETWWV